MAAKVKKATGVDAQLIRSSGGVFEVAVDGVVVHSKKASGDFPDEDGLVRAIGSKAH